jgi:hypothetical protein
MLRTVAYLALICVIGLTSCAAMAAPALACVPA